MRVDLTTFGVEPPENSKTGRAGHTGGAGIATGSAAASTSVLDETRFSFDQTRVQSLGAQVLAQPEIRGAKVEALQEAIGKGEYSVPPSQVADALVSDLAS
jgi:flagellar biosynthesis anti-sigma factor FlgM